MRFLLRSAPHAREAAPTEALWDWRAPRLAVEATLAARGSAYNGYPVSAGYLGSFCLDGLAIALHSVYHTDTFDAAIERCVNYRGDADSTAAVAGQIAGAFYGRAAIGAPLREQLRTWDDDEIAARGLLLWWLHAPGPLPSTAR